MFLTKGKYEFNRLSMTNRRLKRKISTFNNSNSAASNYIMLRKRTMNPTNKYKFKYTGAVMKTRRKEFKKILMS